MKKDKAKVGRPKLADKDLKKQSLLVCIVGLVCIVIIGILFYKIVEMYIDADLKNKTVYNDHIDSCVLYENIIDCGPNVKYMKYSVNNKNYTEVTKGTNSIEVNIKDTKNIKVCYINNTDTLKCIK